MKDIYLINYTVSGIKSIDKPVTLSFYKKTITNNFDIKNYNVKGIYGMNGSGKTGIVTSVDILRRLLTDSSYLSNPVVQKELDGIVNKRTKKLSIEADLIADTSSGLFFFRYAIVLSKNALGKYIISNEKVSFKPAKNKSNILMPIFESVDGNGIKEYMDEKDGFTDILIPHTINLLSMSSICSIFIEKIIPSLVSEQVPHDSNLFFALMSLVFFSMKLRVHLERSDDHREHIMRNTLAHYAENGFGFDYLMQEFAKLDIESLQDISITNNIIHINSYEQFKDNINRLFKFLCIFKPELQGIEIDKRENADFFVCNLIMNYGTYKIHAEFESTGIKKLTKLFSYINAMVQGDIVFIDEFDSNLHDVYLCALLEYLMEYGKGQLCFTTHNVGPMDVLKQNKKSIDFLSTDNTIYPWKTNGNYSPSKLYRNGMIEGSPFNVDSIDFIGVFDTGEEDD